MERGRWCRKAAASSSQFWKAIDIWLRNPHVVDRRILASTELLTEEIRRGSGGAALTRAVGLKIDESHDAVSLRKSLYDIFEAQPTSSRGDGDRLRVKKLLPRNTDLFSPTIEFVLVERSLDRVTCIHKPIVLGKRSVGVPGLCTIQRNDDGSISMSLSESGSEGQISDHSAEWLERKLLPRLISWANTAGSAAPSSIASLSLVSAERYATLYESLKRKYGPSMVKIWPENTDPAKFVYEDVAIAAYLLALWEKERSVKKTERLQSFLDLGCGNGLLVHILSGEGHAGSGIDLRRRKIWDIYPRETVLEVRAVVPSSATVFPGVDWIVGNHSDELTPWVPVIAARSSPDCRFFVLPCCAHEFDGSKYQRRCAGKSQYSEYIDYVRSVSEECGFETKIDRLRIPSTKRICLVGWERSPEVAGDADLTERRIRNLVNATPSPIRTPDELTASTNDWSCGFKPRDSVEKVRNCTQLDKALIADIVNAVTTELLREGRIIFPEDIGGKAWNAGRCLEMKEIAGLIPRDTLARLRNECGGLQTLLKNNGHVFKVVGGRVRFKIPAGEDPTARKGAGKDRAVRRKVKACWFHENHPNGCPTTGEKCNFKH